MYSDSLALDDFIQDFGALKISALTKANKIKHYVRNVTIGPNASDEDEIKVTLTEIGSNRRIQPIIRPAIKSRLGSRKHAANIEETESKDSEIDSFTHFSSQRLSMRSRLGPRIHSATVQNVELYEDDINALINVPQKLKNCNINVDMLRYEANKINRQVIRKNIQERQAKFANADLRFQQILKEKSNASQHLLHERYEKIETDILQDLEKHNQEEELLRQIKLQEHQEQCERLLKQSLAIKRDQEIRDQRLRKKEELDAIYCSQKLFREEYETFLQVLKSSNNPLAQQVFSENSSKLKELINEMEQLTHKCSSGDNSIDKNAVSQAKQLVFEMREVCQQILALFKKTVQTRYNETLEKIAKDKERILALTNASKIENSEIKELTPHVVEDINNKITVKSLETRTQVGGSEREYEHGSIENWKKMVEYKTFIEDFMLKHQQIIKDPSFKKFRFDCQKAINIPVNAIAGKGLYHTQEKLQKLDSLLAGQTIQIGNMVFNAGQHAQGKTYCFDLLAKAIVKQGGLLSKSPESAFPIAFIAVSLWNKYPILGKLLLGYLYEKCPYLLPIYPVRTSDMSEEEYFRILGYEISEDGTLESTDSFLGRICGMGRLYFAIMVVGNGNFHPHDLENAWQWLVDTLNMAPRPDTSASLILQCLEVTGSSQLICYRRQFVKILHLLVKEYMTQLHEIGGISGPRLRLQEFVIKSLQMGMIQPPKQFIDVPPEVEYL